VNQKKKSVSLVWAISRRNVVNGKYLHSTTKARGIDSLCFRSPSAPPLHSLTRGEATDHRFPTPLAFSTMPLVHDDDDDEPVADAVQTETTSPVVSGKAAIMTELFGDDSDDDDDDVAAAAVNAAGSDDENDTDTDDEIETVRSINARKKAAKQAKAESSGAKKGKEKGGKSAGRDISAEEKGVWDALVGGGGDDDDDDEPKKDATDDAFIDDEDVALEDRYGSDDEQSPVASEAEEDDDDLEKLFGSKGGRGGRARQSEASITSEVLNFLARMEVATEQDRESVTLGTPAVHKLRMLKEMTAKLKEVDLHEVFLRHGLLKVLASWLALLPDHNLPNTTVRTAVIDAVRLLPIETDLNDRKEELKRSGLGRMIMFLSSLPQESTSNRKKCKDLVEKWSRPVYELSSQYRDLRQAEEMESAGEPRRKKRKQAGAADAVEDTDVSLRTQDGPKFGERGYRYHAVVPEQEAMDYKKRPKLLIDPSEIKARTQNADQQRVRKLVGKVAKGKQLRDGKAYLPSVEGRGMVTYH
jgi:transcription factor SPN1